VTTLNWLGVALWLLGALTLYAALSRWLAWWGRR
jgi:hypothetical protein